MKSSDLRTQRTLVVGVCQELGENQYYKVTIQKLKKLPPEDL